MLNTVEDTVRLSFYIMKINASVSGAFCCFTAVIWDNPCKWQRWTNKCGINSIATCYMSWEKRHVPTFNDSFFPLWLCSMSHSVDGEWVWFNYLNSEMLWQVTPLWRRILSSSPLSFFSLRASACLLGVCVSGSGRGVGRQSHPIVVTVPGTASGTIWPGIWKLLRWSDIRAGT